MAFGRVGNPGWDRAAEPLYAMVIAVARVAAMRFYHFEIVIENDDRVRFGV